MFIDSLCSPWWREGQHPCNHAACREARFSEFSYGFALTHELVNRFSVALAAAPVFPSLIKEGRSGGYGAALPLSGWTVFLHFKVSQYMTALPPCIGITVPMHIFASQSHRRATRSSIDFYLSSPVERTSLISSLMSPPDSTSYTT
jgi:hypothetical protein